jgi:hypothetical protein
MRTRYVAFFVALMLVVFAVQVSAQQAEPRTQYEAFDLSTPEAAVQTFVDTFHKRDYAGLFLIFAPETQMAWRRALSVFRFEYLVDPSAVDAFMDAFAVGFDHSDVEHSPDLSNYLFDQVMLFAEESDTFLIDLRGDVDILRSEETTIPARNDPEDVHDDDNPPLPAVNVITSVEGIDGEVTFRMVPTPSGRWQVLQVIVPGGDEEIMPWSVVPEDE